MTHWAIIPIKELKQAKQRLSSNLSHQQRESLAIAMAKDVIKAAIDSKKIDKVLIVSRDPEVQKIAQDYQCHLLNTKQDQSLNEAIMIGIDYVQKLNGTLALTIASDIPLVTAPYIDEVIQSHLNNSADISLVSNRQRQGTNALCCSLPTPFNTHYGTNSCQKHQQEAKTHQLNYQQQENEQLALDIDTLSDLKLLQKEPRLPQTHTGKLLNNTEFDLVRESAA